MKKIKIIIHGRPMSKDNEKIFNRQGRPFTSGKFKAYAAALALEAKSQMNAAGWRMLEVPIKIKMTFYFKSDMRLDIFNAPKSICDALNKIVWKDDRLIHQGYLILGYSDEERVEIEAEPAYFYDCINFGPHKGRGGYILAPGTPQRIVKALKKAIEQSGEDWPVETLD